MRSTAGDLLLDDVGARGKREAKRLGGDRHVGREGVEPEQRLLAEAVEDLKRREHYEKPGDRKRRKQREAVRRRRRQAARTRGRMGER